MVDCRKCQRFNACYFDNDDCIGFVPKTMTNGDRIRSMTDEELAEIISSLGNCDTCYLYLNRGCNINTSCKDAVLEWLRKETE